MNNPPIAVISDPRGPAPPTTPNESEAAASIHTGSGCSVSWDVKSFKVKAKGGQKQILWDVWGYASPGKLLAVMGPSGSGKTTLLNILTGRVTKYEGDVKVDGRNVGRDMRHLSGFVPQDDALLGFLTVEENVKFSAKLRIPRKVGAAGINQSVDKVIDAMGLRSVAKRRIGTPLTRGVSGGESRRTSVALEIVTGDPIVFLDEPTSGLDAASAFHIISQLKQHAREENVTVVCTIHQPSTEVYELFDDLLLLAYGRVVYFGTRENALPHFAMLEKPVQPYTNPSDHFLDLINADFAEDKQAAKQSIMALVDRSRGLLQGGGGTRDMMQSWNAVHNQTRGDTTGPQKRYANNVCHQTIVLLHRGLVNAGRNIILYWVRVAMYLAMALLMGTVFFDVGNDYRSVQDRLGAHFFAVAFLCFMSVAVVPAFLEEKYVFDREYDSGAYSCIAYVLALSIVSLPFIILIGVVFTVIAYPMMGLQGGVDHFFIYLLVLVLALYVAESLTLMITGFIPIFVVSLTLTAFANGFFMAVEGFLVKFGDGGMPMFWIWGHYLSYQKYAFEAIAKNDLSGVDFNCRLLQPATNAPAVPAAPSTPLAPAVPPQCQPTGFQCSPFIDELNPVGEFKGDTALEFWLYKYEDVDIAIWCLALVGLVIVFRAAFWFALWFRKRRR